MFTVQSYTFSTKKQSETHIFSMIHNAETLTFSIINHKKAAGICVFDGSEFIVISVSGYTFFFLPDKGCPFSLQQFRQFFTPAHGGCPHAAGVSCCQAKRRFFPLWTRVRLIAEYATLLASSIICLAS